MSGESILHSIFLIFTGAAVIATISLYARQALLVAYIALGLILGPWGFGLVSDPAVIQEIAQVGIIFLLFLLGLNLEPRDLVKLIHEATVVTLGSSLLFFGLGYLVALGFGFNAMDSLLVGAALMFSSTIIGLKLLPTTALHHQHMGEIIVSILLLQDIIAVVILLLLQGLGKGGNPWLDVGLLVIALPLVSAFTYLFSRYVITKLLGAFDQIKEYIFLLAIGWCLGIAELAESLGLSFEVGAFMAGVSLAANPIARYIAESLKPLRDFFLIMFFFAVGAGFNVEIVSTVVLPASILALAALFIKPFIFKHLLKREGEKQTVAGEIGVRLGQISEFSLLISVVGMEAAVLSSKASYLIQTATVITFIASSYWIVMRYPTPIAVNDALRRD